MHVEHMFQVDLLQDVGRYKAWPLGLASLVLGTVSLRRQCRLHCVGSLKYDLLLLHKAANARSSQLLSRRLIYV